MCKQYQKEPDDEWFHNMNPVKKLWMYESWCQDQIDRNDFAKSFSIFLGSFFNPEAAQQILSKDKPDYDSTDEDFEKSTQMILEDRKKKLNKQSKIKTRKRRRRVIR